MNLVIEMAQPHRYCDYETAIYVPQGRVETRFGTGLYKLAVHEAGDFIFTLADVLHQ